MHTYIYIYTHICIHIYIYIERERDAHTCSIVYYSVILYIMSYIIIGIVYYNGILYIQRAILYYTILYYTVGFAAINTFAVLQQVVPRNGVCLFLCGPLCIYIYIY